MKGSLVGNSPSEHRYMPVELLTFDPEIPVYSQSNGKSEELMLLRRVVLGSINRDRRSFGLPPVSLGSIRSAQFHAESMLRFGYFSHWDTSGYKPYMRYTALRGLGAVFENVAWAESSAPVYGSLTNRQKALEKLEWEMLFNDAESGNLHRENILDPAHNQVCLGVAFDANRIYLVQDFENNYLRFDPPIVVADSTIRLKGTSSTSLTDFEVHVQYDHMPQPLSPQTLNQDSRYSGSYVHGDMIGAVFRKSGRVQPFYPGLVNVYTSQWTITEHDFYIQFSLHPFIQQHPRGVVTLCISTKLNSNRVPLTNLSIMINHRFCTKCGHSLKPNASFCGKCGSRLN